MIVGALAGLQLGGVLGVLLAAPTIASARLLLGYAYRKLFDEAPFPAPEVPVDRSYFWRGWSMSGACGRCCSISTAP